MRATIAVRPVAREVSIYGLRSEANASVGQSIPVDTQNETIDVTIKLKRPGLLIGKGGKAIAEVERRLQTVFNMPTKIHIEEVKNDINEPFICY